MGQRPGMATDRAQGDSWNVDRDAVREREQREHKRDDGSVLDRLLRGIEPRRSRDGAGGHFQTDESR